MLPHERLGANGAGNGKRTAGVHEIELCWGAGERDLNPIQISEPHYSTAIGNKTKMNVKNLTAKFSNVWPRSTNHQTRCINIDSRLRTTQRSSIYQDLSINAKQTPPHQPS